MLSGSISMSSGTGLMAVSSLLCLPPFVAVSCPEDSMGEDPASAEKLFYL